MLSPPLLSVISFVFSIASIFHVFPMYWDRVTSRMKPISDWTKVITVFLCLKQWIFFLFLIRQTVNKMSDESTPGKFVFVQLLEIIRLLVGCTCQTVFLIEGDKAVSYINRVLSFNMSAIQEKSSHVMAKIDKHKEKRDVCADLVKLFILAGFVQTSLSFVAFVRRPRMLSYYYSTLNFDITNRFGIVLLPVFALSFLMDSINYWTVVITALTISVISGTGTGDWLKSISASSGTPLENVRIYRCLQLMTLEFRGSVGKVAIPVVQFALILLNIVPFFMTMRLHDHLPLNEFIRIPLRLLTTSVLNAYFFPMLADIQLLSTRFVKSKNLVPLVSATTKFNLRKWNAQALRSCRPLLYSSAAMFFMRKYYALRVFGFVVFYTAKLLMVF